VYVFEIVSEDMEFRAQCFPSQHFTSPTRTN